MQLPDDFIQLIRPVFGEERLECFMKALDEESPVSIRVNPKRMDNGEWRMENSQFQKVPWCQNGFYLPSRPNFTFDPLLHAGCYYVQEASSMFLDEVLRQHLRIQNSEFNAWPEGTLCLQRIHHCLDLCAAPGGKSTLLRSVLPEESVLYSNEPVRKRANILLENVVKWGYPNHFVTNLYPQDYQKSKMKFDLILCDVPCSGEGMFRKDPDSIQEWSLQNVKLCQQLQREIVSNAWQCLNDSGLLIYSTCTYNIYEDEENVRWMKEELNADVLPVDIKSEWGITGSLLKDFNEPVYRFIPGYTRGEGLFMAVLCKNRRHESAKVQKCEVSPFIKKSILVPPFPCIAEAPKTDLPYHQAIAYLRGEALVLPPDVPRGLVTVTFMGYPLGQVKNIGSRANNLYPKEWRIKSTHIPQEYETIFRLA